MWHIWYFVSILSKFSMYLTEICEIIIFFFKMHKKHFHLVVVKMCLQMSDDSCHKSWYTALPYISCFYRIKVSVLILVSSILALYVLDSIHTKICSIAHNWEPPIISGLSKSLQWLKTQWKLFVKLCARCKCKNWSTTTFWFLRI